MERTTSFHTYLALRNASLAQMVPRETELQEPTSGFARWTPRLHCTFTSVHLRATSALDRASGPRPFALRLPKPQSEPSRRMRVMKRPPLVPALLMATALANAFGMAAAEEAVQEKDAVHG